MEAILKRLVDGFGGNPLVARRAMRELLDLDRAQFRDMAVSVMSNGQESAGEQYLAGLLLTSGLAMDVLANPELASLEVAIEIARRAVKVDPLLEVRLLRLLVEGGEGDRALRLLEILDAISNGSRIVTLLPRLLESTDARVRSKATLLLGRTFHDARWAVQLLSESDPRVRANAIESLWGSNSPDCVSLFRVGAGDMHNRVAGNSLLGLYFAGEIEAIAGLAEMAAHPQPAFRSSAFWAMGQSGDPRFLPLLRGVAETGPGGFPVRSAKKALDRLEVTCEGLRCRPRFVSHLLSSRKLGGGKGGPERELRVTVALADGAEANGLSALNFVIYAGGRPLSQYAVREVRPAGHPAVGFALPRTVAGDRSVFCQALEACLKHPRRRCDAWGILHYCGSAPSREDATPQAPVRFLSESVFLAREITAATSRDESARNLMAAAHRLAAALKAQRGARHVVLLASPDSDQDVPEPGQVQQLRAEAESLRITVHGIVPPACPLSVQFAVQDLARQTGGCFFPNVPEDELQEALRRIYLGILGHYRLAWPAADLPETGKVEMFSDNGYGEFEF